MLISIEKTVHVKVSTGDFEGTDRDSKCIKEEYSVIYEFRKLLYLWDTSHDSLDWHAEHKPETIEFLHSIICK